MAEVTTFTCDVCGAVKGTVNKWFDMRVVPGKTALVQPFDRSMKLGDGETHYHLCGQKCVVEKLSELMKG